MSSILKSRAVKVNVRCLTTKRLRFHNSRLFRNNTIDVMGAGSSKRGQTNGIHRFLLPAMINVSSQVKNGIFSVKDKMPTTFNKLRKTSQNSYKIQGSKSAGSTRFVKRLKGQKVRLSVTVRTVRQIAHKKT